MKVLSLLRDEVVLGIIVKFWASDNPPYTENCDSVIGYDVYNAKYDVIDGGEMDFNSLNYNEYLPIDEDKELLDDLFNFIAPDYRANDYKIIAIEEDLLN